MKAEFNHKSCDEHSKSMGNTRHTHYVCSLFWALFSTETWFYSFKNSML